MPRFVSKSTLTAVVVSAVALGAGAGGITFAASQAGSDNVISACMSVKTGDLRLPTKSRPCVTDGSKKTRERVVSWNKQGIQGDIGEQGEAGAQGEAGPAGAQGPAGPQGERGPVGPQGATGSAGTAGANGADGAKWLNGTGAPIDARGVEGDWYVDVNTSWAYQKVDGSWEQVVRLQGPQGTPGAAGSQGPAGQSANVSIGTTTTLPAGSAATVTNNGTATNAILNFGIPRGAAGASAWAGYYVVQNAGSAASALSNYPIPVACPSGKMAIGGGVLPANGANLTVNGTGPVVGSDGYATGWTNVVSMPEAGQLSGYAVCVNKP